MYLPPYSAAIYFCSRTVGRQRFIWLQVDLYFFSLSAVIRCAPISPPVCSLVCGRPELTRIEIEFKIIQKCSRDRWARGVEAVQMIDTCQSRPVADLTSPSRSLEVKIRARIAIPSLENLVVIYR